MSYLIYIGYYVVSDIIWYFISFVIINYFGFRYYLVCSLVDGIRFRIAVKDSLR